MRIRLDILRDILRLVIEDESGDLSSYAFKGDGISSKTIAFHIKILINVSFLNSSTVHSIFIFFFTSPSFCVYVNSITCVFVKVNAFLQNNLLFRKIHDRICTKEVRIWI